MLLSSEKTRLIIYIIATLSILGTASFEIFVTKDLTSSLIIAITGAGIVIYFISMLIYEDIITIKKEALKTEVIYQLSKDLLDQIGLFPILHKSNVEFEILDRGGSYSKSSMLLRNAKKRIMLIYRTPAFFFPMKKSNPGNNEERAFVEVMNTYVIPKCQKNILEVIIGFNHADPLFLKKVNELSDEKFKELLENIQKWKQYMEISNLRIFSFGEPNIIAPEGIANIELVDDIVSLEIITYPNSRWKLRIKNEDVSERLFTEFKTLSSEGIDSTLDFLNEAYKARLVKAQR